MTRGGLYPGGSFVSDYHVYAASIQAGFSGLPMCMLMFVWLMLSSACAAVKTPNHH